MGKTFKEQFVEALENGITHKAIFLAQFMKDEINEPYDYRSPLVWASRYGNEKVIKALSDMGAVEVVDKEGMGVELKHILWVQDIDEIDEKRAIELIKDGANLEKKDKFGNTALIKASRCGCLEVVKALLSSGAKVDEKNNHDYTALIKASEYGHVEVAKLLLSMGAIKTINEKDEWNNTALIMASKNGHVEIVKALLSRGAKVDEKNNHGETALIWASLCGHVEVVEALLDAGADVTIANNDGKAAIDFTINDEIKKLLNEAMRKQKEKQNKKTFKNKISGLFGR